MTNLQAQLAQLWQRFTADAVRRTRHVWAQLKKNNGW